MKNRKKQRSPLNDLAPELAAEIERLLESGNEGGRGMSLKEGVAWLWRKHRIRTNTASLSRWLGHRRTNSDLNRMIASIRQHDRYAGNIASQALRDGDWQIAIERLIHDLAFAQIASGQQADPDTMQAAIRMSLEARKVQLKEREVAIDEKKLARLEEKERRAEEARKELEAMRSSGQGMSKATLDRMEKVIKLL